MDQVPAAISLARALLALSRARATGVLEVMSAHLRARVAVTCGTPRAAAMPGLSDETLGDLLARHGALDVEAHARALERSTPWGPVGDWLVANGAATRPAVEWALRRQLERRIARLFEWSTPELRFRRGLADVGVAHVAEPVRTGDLVLDAMRSAVAQTSLVEARRRLGDGMLVLSRLGEALVTDATLWPEEAAMIPLLKAGATVIALVGAGGGGRRAILGLHALRLVGAVQPPGDHAYTVLLRKHRQLRHAARADALDLLDLPARARPEEARRALRRLAQLVHPDRFGENEAPAVRAASANVMTALVEAEHRVTRRAAR